LDWDDSDDDDMSGFLAFLLVCIWVWTGGGLLVERIAVFRILDGVGGVFCFFCALLSKARCYTIGGALDGVELGRSGFDWI
jgi:hypothetical protein